MPLNSALADKPTLYVTETKMTLFKNKFLEIKLLIFACWVLVVAHGLSGCPVACGNWLNLRPPHWKADT